jgi:small GTP-binding protein
MPSEEYLEEIKKKIKEAGEKQLKKLDLSGEYLNKEKELTQIPGEVFELEHLEKLYLGFNKLTTVPESISKLKNLTELILYENQLTTVPESIAKLQNLTSLYLNNNQLTTVPESIAKLQNLTELNLYGNQLTTVPESIAKLKNLTSLDLYRNQLTTLPESIAKLQNLTSLILGSNQFPTVPESIETLEKLQWLALDSFNITTIPEFICNLPALYGLVLSGNNIESLPKCFSKLKKLKSLRLQNNNFSKIPELVYKLPLLEEINFNNESWLSEAKYKNRIKEISPKILQLENLKTFGLEDNPIETPPPEVVFDKEGETNLEGIKNYFRQLEREKDYLYEAKLLIVGEGGAGKTTLAKKIENNDYVLKEDEPTTEGIDVIKWEFPLPGNKNFRVNIWDFGGQEIYHATHQFFLTKRSLYILVADTRKEDTDFYYWLNVVELLSGNSPLLIIKNEIQDRLIEKFSERELRGQFTNLKETLAANLATNRGLSEILKAIKLYISNLPHIGTKLPKTWVKVRETLEKDNRNYISLDEYLSICQENGFDRLEDKLQLSG